MLNCFTTNQQEAAIPILSIIETEWAGWLSKQESRVKNWSAATGFIAKSGTVGLLCDKNGHLERVLVGINSPQDAWIFGQLATTLPKGVYQIEKTSGIKNHHQAMMAWGLGSYQFTPYKKQPPFEAKLLLPKRKDLIASLESLLTSTFLVRDLINTPPDDMMPGELAEAAIRVADEYGAKARQIIGDDLLKEDFPAIYAVGRGSSHAQRLVDIRWGNPKHPKVTLVGKGVCFDTGGLDLKSASGMSLMKKDMAGAAHAIGLARMIMAAGLPIALRVLIPAVENAISAEAYHPSDILMTRKGITVEVTNTDAEGRLILCDALAEAARDNPALILDFSTLTGAARVALGPDVSAVFANDDELAKQLIECGQAEMDPIWALPLYAPYRKFLDSPVADISNAASVPYGGAITAALFLNEFVPKEIPWAHFDLMAWNLNARPGRPEGGEAMALRAVFKYLKDRFK